MIRVYETIDEIPWLRIIFKDDSRVGLIVESNDEDKVGTEYRSRLKPSENKHLKLNDLYQVFKKHRDIDMLIVAFYSESLDNISNGEAVKARFDSVYNICEFSRSLVHFNSECLIDLSEDELLYFKTDNKQEVSDNSPNDIKVVEEFLQKDNEQLGMKFDNGKLRYGLVPHIAFKGLAEVLTFGADKYAPNSWKTVPNGKERYLDALYRHIEAYRNGEILDSESGLSHLSHAMTNCAFLLHFQEEEIHAKV